MALGTFELSAWGPKKLRELFKKVTDRINQTTPIAGCGLKISEEPQGLLIEVDIPALVESVESAQTGAGGSNVNLYGAFSGAPAVFHLKQSSPPTPVE